MVDSIKDFRKWSVGKMTLTIATVQKMKCQSLHNRPDSSGNEVSHFNK